VWIIDVVRDVMAYGRGTRVRKGDRVRALVDIEIGGLIYYRAPFTTSFRGRIPRGGVLPVYDAPDGWAFLCTIDDPVLEAAVVPESDRLHHAYAGCAISFGLGEIGRRLEVLQGEA
jgi:hypothetical protein